MGNTIANLEVTPSQVSGRLGTWHRVMEEAGLTYDDLQTPIDNPDFRKRLVQFWHGGEATGLPAPAEVVSQDEFMGMFILPERQLELVRQRNADRTWGFTDEDFTKLGEPPAWPSGRLSAVVLEVSLDTVQKTFEEAWHFTKACQPDNWRWPEVKSDPKLLRLLSGIQHQHGLRWRVVDLAANWDKRDGIRPRDVRNPQTSPHCAILWGASYFPKWVRAMDGMNVPYVWIPGYELCVSGDPEWSGVPSLGWVRDDRRVRLGTGRCGARNGRWAVPEFRE